MIKFRVWNKDHYDQGFWTYQDGELDHHYTLVSDVIVQLSTRLFDKNKKEIYEGDILLYSSENPADNGLYVCEYKTNGYFSGFVFNHVNKCYKHEGNTNELEIVGNIFENPKLLKLEKVFANTKDALAYENERRNNKLV